MNKTMYTYDGKTQCLSAWADEYDLYPSTIKKRIDRGWSVERAVTTPGKTPTDLEKRDPERHAALKTIWMRRSRQNTRYDVIKHYSDGKMECELCKIRTYDVLTLDHIGGGGNEHRRSLSGQSNNYAVYSLVRREGYPPGYRVLCRNCNWLTHAETYPDEYPDEVKYAGDQRTMPPETMQRLADLRRNYDTFDTTTIREDYDINASTARQWVRRNVAKGLIEHVDDVLKDHTRRPIYRVADQWVSESKQEAA